MLKLIISTPTYKAVNRCMWAVINHCEDNDIPCKKIDWVEWFIKTKRTKIQFCLENEFKSFLKRRTFDSTFTFDQVEDLLRYITECEKFFKCDLKAHRDRLFKNAA